MSANKPSNAPSDAWSALNLGSNALKGLAVSDNTRWFPNGPLAPNAVFVNGNGYRYASDMFGRPVTASGNLTLNSDPIAPTNAAASALKITA